MKHGRINIIKTKDITSFKYLENESKIADKELKFHSFEVKFLESTLNLA